MNEGIRYTVTALFYAGLRDSVTDVTDVLHFFNIRVIITRIHTHFPKK